VTESEGVPFESNPPPDAMPDLDLEVEGLPFAAPEATGADIPPEPADDQEEQQ
jgi:hypothetical protein